ncbi:MAG: hypothetical protein EOP18_09420 [Rhizobiaceae bacterium]|nr:MAG: hypothetical protein EOP18_09420 [Rhizobiaceae bacterium]
MPFMMYVIAVPVAFLGLVVWKGIAVRRAIEAKQYSWKVFAVFALAWFAWTVPGLESVCTELGCRYSMRFGWFLSSLAGSTPLGALRPDAIVALSVLGYAILTLYFCGHCFGWLLHGVARMSRPKRA